MPHDHTKHHHHTASINSLSKAFIVGIVLNGVFVIVEFATGFFTNSLALLSDAGHNLSDVATLGLSLFAFQMTKQKPTSKYTYGFNKGTIIASLVNSVILFIAVGSIGWEAIHRFINPVETEGKVISLVAGIGIVINTISAVMFFRDKEKDLNVKGAYLHLALDAIVSVGVVISGVIITYTGFKWIDPLISILIMGVIIYSTWGLLKESLKLSLDAVPSNVDLEKIKIEIVKIKNVNAIEHIHVWAMSTTKNAMTAHLIIDENLNEKEIADIKHKVKHELEHLNIQHATLETESKISDHEKC